MLMRNILALLTLLAIGCIAPEPHVDVLIMGDSIAARWPQEIWQEHMPGVTTKNIAISGALSHHLLNNIPYYSHYTADSILLNVGVNDLRAYVPEQTLIDNVTAIVDNLKATHPTAHIFLVYPHIARPNVLTFNTAIDTAYQNMSVTYINAYDTFMQDFNLTHIDDVHLSNEGYQRYGALLAQYIQ